MVNKSNRTDNEILEEINCKLDRILYAISLQGKGIEEKVELLHKLNYGYKEISQISGIPLKTVDNLINIKLKKKHQKSKVESNEPNQ